jgi:hypothetical protein
MGSIEALNGHAVPANRPAVRAALAALLEAHELAAHTGRRPEDYALDLSCLIVAGSSPAAMQWLVESGYAAHLLPGGRGAGKGKRPVTAGSRFLLTDAGLTLARTVASPPPATGPALETSAKPRWDAKAQQLTFAGRLVKTYRQPAANQGLILAAFEEESWPSCIDDPLPFEAEIDPPKRLQDTVRRLNEQPLPVLLFHANGSGEGVCWEPRTPPAARWRPKNAGR